MTNEQHNETEQAQPQIEMLEYIFANDFSDPRLRPLLNMFYTGCFTNTVGIMNAYNKETGENDLLLVGVEHDPETNLTNTYPLAVILASNQISKYAAPDGKGGYFGDDEETGDDCYAEHSIPTN